jgi:hypothetical protein
MSVENRFGFHIPMNPVTAVRKTYICSVKALLLIRAVIVSEEHNISAFVTHNSRVKSQRGRIRNIFPAEYFTGIAADDGTGF